MIDSRTGAAVSLSLSLWVIPATLAQGTLDPDGDGLATSVEEAIGTNPLVADTDGDGLLDGREVIELGTDALSKDTDGDALPDGPEVGPVGTSPTDPDSDGGDAGDGREDILDGTDPLLGGDDLPADFGQEMNFFTTVDLTQEILPRLLSRIAVRFELDTAGRVALDQAQGRLAEATIPILDADLRAALGPLTSLTEAELPLVFRSLATLGYRPGAVEQVVLSFVRSVVTYIRLLLAPGHCIVRARLTHTLDFSHRAQEPGSNHGRRIKSREDLTGTRIVGSADPDRAFVPEAWFDSDIETDNPRNAAVVRLWWEPLVRLGKAPGRKRLVARILQISDWPGVAINAGPRPKDFGRIDHDMGPEDSRDGELYLNNSELVDQPPGDGVVDEARKASFWERIDLDVGRELSENDGLPGLVNVRDENAYRALTTLVAADETRDLRIRNFDWGGSCVVFVQDEAGDCLPAVVTVPVDRDRDLLPDFWEKEMLGRARADQVMKNLVSDTTSPELGWYARAYFARKSSGGARFRSANPLDPFSLVPPGPLLPPGLVPRPPQGWRLVPDSLVDMDPAPFALDLSGLAFDRLANAWGLVGDGLVNFEEYRGVYTLDAEEIPVVTPSSATTVHPFLRLAPHRRLDPWEKDLFVDLFHQPRVEGVERICDPAKLDRVIRQGYSHQSGRLVHSVSGLEQVGLVHGVDRLPDGNRMKVTEFQRDESGNGEFKHDIPVTPNGYTETVDYYRGDIEGFLKDVRRLKKDTVDFDSSFYDFHAAWGAGRPDPRPYQRAHRIRLVPPTEGASGDKVGQTPDEPWGTWPTLVAYRHELEQYGGLDGLPDINANGSPNEAGPSLIYVEKIRARTEEFHRRLTRNLLAPFDVLSKADPSDEITLWEIFDRARALDRDSLAARSVEEAIRETVRARSPADAGVSVGGRVAIPFEEYVDQCRITLVHETTHALGVTHPDEKTFHPAHDMILLTLPDWFEREFGTREVPESCNQPSVMLRRVSVSGHHHPRYTAMGVVQAESKLEFHRPLLLAVGRQTARWGWGLTAEGYTGYATETARESRVYNDLDRLEMRWHLKHRLTYQQLFETVRGR